MNDFKLKLILSILSGIVFSFIFILLTFTMPLDKDEIKLQPKNKLEIIAKSIREK